ncbi:hypothetical protein KC717_00640, partial [Candidatus Dojkabacteria bacterium]|nr:hypothetical protein [Candidatus Dojkabacteria bacterium]
RLHSEFLGALSYSYLTSKNRIQKFYQTAVYLFSNNYWDVPSIIRTWSMSLSMPVLASSVTHRKNRETWSCYSINLGVMKKVNYWDTSICIDDTPFFWRPFDFFNGEFECEVFYIPLFADAVYHPNKITNLIEQYHQLVRWGWGIISFPIACKVLLENKNIPLSKKFKKLGVMFELFVVVKIAAILFAVSLPILFLIHQDFGGHVYLYSLPKTLSVLMTLLTCCMIPMLYIKYQLLPSHPSDWNKFKQVGHFLIEVPLHFVILYTYAFIPFLIGPLMMMLGKNYEYKIIKKF